MKTVTLNRLVKVLEGYGVELCENPKGKHKYRFHRSGSRPYTVPVKKKTASIPSEYWRGVCRHFGLEWKTIAEQLSPEKGKKTEKKAAK